MNYGIIHRVEHYTFMKMSAISRTQLENNIDCKKQGIRPHILSLPHLTVKKKKVKTNMLYTVKH